jgi:hypothetical protein
MGNSEAEMTDAQQIDLGPTPAPGPKKSSGYRRLQVRHHTLITEHEVLKAELAERDQIESELQASIDRLLEQHKRIMQTVKGPVRYGEPPPSWHEGANAILGQLENNPERLALQTMTAWLAQLQSRLSAIIMRTTL